MPRFLFCPWPAAGDVLPLLAVADALRDRGHDVAFFGSSRVAPLIAGGRYHLYPSAEPRRRRGRGSGGLRHMIKPLPGEASLLRRAADHFRPDVLIDGVTPFSPRLVSEQLGIPHASIPTMACPLPSADLFPAGTALRPPRDRLERSMARAFARRRREMLAPEVEAWNAARRALGLGPVDEHPWHSVPSRHLVILPTTPAFEYRRRDLPPHAHFVGPILYRGEGDGPLPASLRMTEPGPPWVYVSQGTFFNEEFPVIELVMRALAEEAVRLVVCTVREVAPSALGTVPANARVHSFLPLYKMTPHLSLVVTHGGPGTVNEALAAGVPLLVMPMGADQPEVARRCVEAGVGLWLDYRSCSEEDVRRAVRELLSDERFRRNARRVQRSYARHDGAAESASLLERLAETREPVLKPPRRTSRAKSADPQPHTVELDERLRIMDSIVGRCVRDPEFGEAVLADPVEVLRAYELSELELDDFRALARHHRSPRPAWAGLNKALWKDPA